MIGKLARITAGRLTVVESGERRHFGTRGTFPLEGTVVVHDSAFWERVAWGGSIGAGEAYCDGLWSTPDLTTVVRILARNQEVLQVMDSGIGSLAAPLHRFLHRQRTNTKSGSIRNIAAHYDTGNEFFSTFLDATLTYSCAIFPDALSTLETAQEWKLDTICTKLGLDPDDHLLEIGTGWGGLAIHAARKYGCRVTTTTISQQQFSYASRAVAEADLEDRITVLQADYRDLPAAVNERFDKLASIEMIEAVGHRYLPTYFDVIDRMLKPDGLVLLQAITIPDQRYETYRRSVDFIQHYIFPGAILPSMARIQECVKKRTDLRLVDVEDLTPHYARTLKAWSDRFETREDEIAALGLSEAERKKWKYYFGYCEGGFLERTIGNVHMLFGKPLNRRDVQPGRLV
ncbi:MAG: cyclopropane-fatty-acyl-phospholipid synthase family protein [Acidobacteriota bacterium]|nr:cyclopropane-fatty-acyl-phospholipid synthase family protein [Acidobacteriota bacterium]